MTNGELDYAIRQALNNLDRWNNCTGVVKKGSGYYYELQSVVEDAVKIGSRIAIMGIEVGLSLDDILNDEEGE